MTDRRGTLLALEAPAKLNLSLAVLGRRADGYHELAGVMVLLELADRLTLRPGDEGLTIDGGSDVELPPDRDANLAWRGLRAAFGDAELEARLTLEKSIPVAAGLGGGSSDGAAAWRLGRRWVAAPPAEAGEIAGLAGRLGADVPFFAAAVPSAYVSGRGERVEPLAAATARPHVVLVDAGFRLPTADVFAALRPAEWSRQEPPRDAAVAGANDLLPAARRLRPELDDLAAAIRTAGGEPHLTGSGPTFFCLTDDAERAADLVARLAAAGVRATPTRLRTQAATIRSIAGEREHDAEEEP